MQKNSKIVEGTNATRNGVKAVFNELLNENELGLGQSQAREFNRSTVDNRGNESENGEEYNAIDLDKATWSYLKRSRCLGTSLRHSEQGSLTK